MIHYIVIEDKIKNMENLRSGKVNTNENDIEQVLSRGIETLFPNKDFIKSRMIKGEKLSLYLGVDPTGPTLHLGHAIPLKKLGEFQKLGHKIILLIGDFTAMIGDPTDKSAARKKLTRDQVLENCREYKKQASHFISFEGDNPAEIRFNSDWLAKMSFAEVVDLASLVTVDQMLKRDMFEKRTQEGKPIYIHEFMYPLMQGYDSVAMDVDGEVGGNDQTFNMLTGRDMMKSMKNKEKFVVAVSLLTDGSGKKMGKTEGNMVSLNQTPEDMFGKIMSWSDSLIIPGFEIVTDVSVEEIATIKKSLDSGTNPRDIKIRLAKEIVSKIHGVDLAEQAQVSFENTFTKGEVPDETKVITTNAGVSVRDLLVKEGIVTSNADWKRLVDGNAVSVVGTDELIKDIQYKTDKDTVLRIGKKRFAKIKII